ncbi:MAG TPA: NosD domain-containing protein [Actinomycetota bacterium]|nr:NosD domain-containing protein [Actinomycetota bacterium]
MSAGRALAPLALASLVLAAPFVACAGTGAPPRPARGLPERPASDLQAAIEAAAPGATVRVPAARYVGTVVVDRPVSLEAEPGAVLDGGGQGSVVTVLASGVSLRGFRIRGSGLGPVGEPSGVLVEAARDVRLEDLTISGTYLGITVRGTRGVLIRGVRIVGRPEAGILGEEHAVEAAPAGGPADAPGPDEARAPDAPDQGHPHDAHGEPVPPPSPAGTAGPRGDGIWLWNVVDAVVRDSRISATRDGIYLSYGARIRLEGNVISDARYGIHDMYARDLAIRRNVLRGNLSGCVLMYGGPVLVEGNAIVDSGSPSTGFGVLVKDAGDVLVRGNAIVDDRVAVHVDDAGRTGGAPARIERNLIAANQVGVVLYPSSRPTFTGNAFVENAAQVVLGGTGRARASWSQGGVGNHWSDYQGFDADGDGIGDVPYVQGGRVGELVARSPVLLALASGPALRLVEAVEERWAPREPIVVDPAPLMRPVRPRVPAFAPGEAGSPALAAAGLLLAGAGGAGLALGRRAKGGGPGV